MSFNQQGQAGNRTLLQKVHLDGPLLLGLLTISAIGFLILYSAGGENWRLLNRQLVRLAVAFGGLFLLAQIPPHHLRRYTPILFSAGVLLLIAVLVMGEVGKGAQRWLDLGFFRFQPSEMLKLATPMMVAYYLADRPLPPNWKHLFFAALFIIIPAFLIARQPDLGTALLVASSGVAAIFLAGIRWRILIAIGASLGGLLPVLWHFMREYQKQRVLTFLNPENDPLGAGYHIIQSKIAIGSGGLYGKGWLNGTQSHLEFLPERSTDFIFAVFAEEFGLVGCILLLTLYLLIVSRCIYISVKAQDTYSRLLAGALGMTFFIYVFVNIGMVIGILPVVGVPLPLVSYGGTSMVTLLAGFGILMSIQTHRKLLPT
jgi:rod shape determining protein RodA